MAAPWRTPWLASALVLCAALAIASAPWALSMPVLNWIFKPLATLVVIAHAWPRGRDAPGVRRWVLVGLVFSLGGDVALLWPQQGFLPGLVSFLLAHLAYLVAFTRVQRLAAWPLAFVAYALVAGFILWRLWPGVPAALQIPVVAYVLCLAAMAAQAAVLWRRGAERGARLALGGALFLASDALLATNKFAGPLPLASLWILGTYWSAQWCIASWLKPR
ncbi:MAG: lysoplasmalogenase [Betaproteobacteria bacterium]|nr:lysoplasmalogenase [Betaproteobacteria bacterium]MBK7457895.1 lysoplasmalogenase [Betaproteobacteria bacterium]MBK8105072.1 lysoplasmalogenase [Betaproteobacteria bacterium]